MVLYLLHFIIGFFLTPEKKQTSYENNKNTNACGTRDSIILVIENS